MGLRRSLESSGWLPIAITRAAIEQGRELPAAWNADSELEKPARVGILRS